MDFEIQLSEKDETCSDFQSTKQGSSMDIEQSQFCSIIVQSNLKISKQNTKRNNKKNNRQIQFVIQNIYPTLFSNYYVMSGDVSVYIGNDFEERDPIYRKVETIYEQQCYKQMIVDNRRVLNNLSLPIELLERSQSQQKYYYAQRLKEYEQLIQYIHTQMKYISDAYQNNLEELDEIIYQRQLYRKRKLNENLKETMSQEDFYYIIEITTNFNLNQLNLQQITLSKSLFALIGVDCNDIDSYLLRNGISDLLFMNEREVLFPAIFDVCNKEKNKFYRFKDFQINTLDQIRLYSDADIMFYNVQYPPDLYFKIDDEHFNQNVEMIIKIKYDIQPNHIIQILNIRNQNSVENNYTKSIEYSILSQIFLEKFYPKELKELNKSQSEIPKECKYRVI